MKMRLALLALFFASTAMACRHLGGSDQADVRASGLDPASAQIVERDGDGDESEVMLTPEQIPAVVKAAALAALPGLVIEDAEREWEDGRTMFCVHGRVDGVFHEVEVTADGSKAVVEEDEDDDDEDSEDGD